MKKFNDYISEEAGYVNAPKLVNEKLESMGIDMKFTSIESSWGGRAEEKVEHLRGDDIPLFFRPLVDYTRIEVKPTYEPKYHGTYNPNPHIFIKINYWIQIGGKYETHQIFCTYYLSEEKWRKDELRGGQTGKNIYT